MDSIKRKLRKFYDVRVRRDQKRIAFYNYLDEGGESLRFNYPLGRDSIVIDAGGYIGDFAAEMAKKYDCRIDIFEPVERYVEKIKARFKSNNKIQVIHAGLGAEEKEELINISGLGSSVFDDSSKDGNKERIKIVSAIEYIRSKGYSIVDLMKINIEGGEYELLNSLLQHPDLIKRIGFFQIQFHDFIPNASVLRNEIRDELSKTHKLTWDFPFIWESWEIK